MNGKQLKNSILQWAIQGKLVPQDPNDEPASVLLERIRAEKARLVKEGKIKKDKNESIIFRGDDNSHYEKFLATGEVKCIDDEIPFEIPQGWEWARIRDISRSYIGLTYSPADVSPNGPIVLRSSNIKDGKLHLDDIVRVKASVPEKLWVEKNDIIICARNGSKKLVGKSAIIPEVSEPMTFGAFMAICKTSLWKYVFCFLQSDLFFSQLREVSGTTTINQLTQNNFNGFLIPIPPYSEQERIFEQLNAILPLIETYSKQQENIDAINNSIRDRLKKSILQEAIKGGLLPQIAEEGTAENLLAEIRKEKQKLLKEGKLKKKDFTESVIFKGDVNKYYERINGNLLDISDEVPFDLPDTWAWCRFLTIVNYRIGKTPARGETAYWHPASIPWVSISDMKEYGLVQNTKERISNEASKVFGDIVPKGTLLMSFKLTVGRTAFLDINAFHNEAIISIFPYAAPEVMKRYLFYTLPLLANMGDSKDAIKGKTLNSNSINNLLIPVPPVATQKAIINKIQEAFSNL